MPSKKYQTTQKPVYRGINASKELSDLEHYEPGVVGNWAQFSSCSQIEKQALGFAQMGKSKYKDSDKEFKLLSIVYLTNKNSP